MAALMKSGFSKRAWHERGAFTLIEILVVISVVAILLAILMLALASARLQARGLVCRSNLRQLVTAGIGYATENDGFYVPAASDMWDNAGLCRWHGVRESLDEPFDPVAGPLAGYLGEGAVKECPARVDFVKGAEWDTNFEQGCGGYGYNMTYIGSRLWQAGGGAMKDAYLRTTRMTEVGRPAQTLMFADTAMSNDGRRLIEYSFAEPPFTVYNGRPVTGFYMSPSIHFRHRRTANAGWADGHVETRRRAEFDRTNVFGADSAALRLGWFEPVDNTPFDLK
ncbi:MAG: prepilin-type N-terminal cleavage/methylation domain-containing protein [Phycisphaerales bacterium]|nr:MAG: prepilin-type N-terminal cleavage/methylation domain-containing protein [Phycisphaerales bacterium]